jgi:heme/copper-type cytochrome/quinol oxidase subunit 2
LNPISINIDPTSIGILIAVLALWAQLWVGYSKPDNVPRKRVVSIGLSWIYFAIFFGFFAFVATLLIFSSNKSVNNFQTKFADICFLTSLILGLISIGHSAFTLIFKLGSEKTHDDMPEISKNQYQKSFRYIVALIIIILIGSALIITWNKYAGLTAWFIALVVGLKLYYGVLKTKVRIL